MPQIACAQRTPATGNAAIVTQLDHQLSFVEHEVIAAAEAMPEGKYSFIPTDGDFKGVRNFAQQIKHIAIGNYHIYGPIIPDDPDAGTGDSATASVQTKEQILKYLRDSFVFAHRAIAAINSQNMLLPVKRAPNRAGRYHVGVGRLRLLARERHLRSDGRVPTHERNCSTCKRQFAHAASGIVPLLSDIGGTSPVFVREADYTGL